MIIGIISDLHGFFTRPFREFLSDTDEIWCLGDIWTEEIYKEIASLGKPIAAVSGNWEEEQGSDLYNKLRKTMTFTREGLKIILSHKQNIYEAKQKKADIHCYGHVHRFHAKKVFVREDGKPTYLINPGAITPLYEATASAVKIEIKDGQITGQWRMTKEAGSIAYNGNGYRIATDSMPSVEWLDTMFPAAQNIAYYSEEDKEFQTFFDKYRSEVIGKAEGDSLAFITSTISNRTYCAIFADIDKKRKSLKINGVNLSPKAPRYALYDLVETVKSMLNENGINVNYIEYPYISDFGEQMLKLIALKRE